MLDKVENGSPANVKCEPHRPGCINEGGGGGSCGGRGIVYQGDYEYRDERESKGGEEYEPGVSAIIDVLLQGHSQLRVW